jgi:RNA polymerase sigma-70 factor (ECF subfamily)
MENPDTRDFAALLEAAWPQAYRIAWTILRSGSEAEDAAQEACARALRSMTSLRDIGAFKTWFYKIVVNEARGRLRGRRLDPIAADPAAPSDAADDRIDVRRAIDRLDPMDRLAIVLFYFVELPTAEIATIMQSTPLAVRLRLMTARRRLRDFLQPRELQKFDEENVL